MEILVKVAQLILSLSILVILHEFGHFVLAKIFNTRVEKFYLFFNPGFSLFRFKKGETEYGMGWLPLGGYVKISGMIDESMDKEQMKKPPQPYEFRAKPSWQRLLIMLGGVFMNFLLAILIYASILFVWGEQYLPADNVKYGIAADSLAESIGFQDGDKVMAVDGKPVKRFSEVPKNILLNKANQVTVLRDGA
ncbi:MAG: site-2 protease family protein, partial [Bacteroidales bacterium]|nr:site-2 protease family protein [Bacteroidales bacterium]